ncbi:winged helix-turn-helix domain-containing protein [Streptomyces sp. PTM05]|uniref:Winged helix-turn-helix domain-containing protein n=1 Tax=Streptantibioticus parmotrematis TaxID=2873249 RepID=A0ABS7QPT4_9ACTN|nr:winged helix-turn-helix domain-containing protein [Streptantibioticus parmotrematis]MBY8885206.1 winged helix-turn-helix domain-containing protein [Streptantibioticus parmotrematis]
MGLRIRLSDADVRRVGLAGEPDVLWEALLAAHMTQCQDGVPVFGRWRRQARRRLRAPMRRLLDLAPPRGYSPDFLTPSGTGADLSAGLEAVRRVPHDRLRDELAVLAAARPASPWTVELATGSSAAVTRLAEGMEALYRELVAPHEAHVRAQLAADRAVRVEAVLRGGVDRLLSTLHPSVEWRPPVLEVHGLPSGPERRLDGRGLLLVPAFFCWQRATLLQDARLPPVLVYPIRHDPRWQLACGEEDTATHSRLSALMGRTRAAVLEATADGMVTTGQVARRVGSSEPNVSEHLRTLREAELVVSFRDGGTVRHSLSRLGCALLDGRPAGL